MLKQENCECKNGVILIHSFSDSNKYIKQIETGNKYVEAYDMPNKYTYEETNEEIEVIEEEQPQP